MIKKDKTFLKKTGLKLSKILLSTSLIFFESFPYFALTTMVLSPVAFEAKAGAKVGPFDVDLKFCKDFEKWSGILSAYSNVSFPVTGAVGVTMGVMTNTSVIVDFCQFMTQMATLDTQGQIFLAAETANKLSGNQFTDEMDLVTGWWDMTNVVYDLQSGKGRKASWESPATHRRLNNLIRKSADYSDKKGFTETPINLRTRQEQEQEMSRLSRIAYQRAILKEATSCPAPKDNTQYDDVYNKEILPLEEANAVLQIYIDFYRNALLEMSKKILMPKEFEGYANDLNLMATKSTSYRSEVMQKTQDSVKLKSVGAKPTSPTAKKTEEYIEKVKRNYQKFSTTSNSEPLQTFIKKYDDKWKHFVLKGKLSTSFGILNNPTKRVEDEFKDFSIICNRGKYSQQFNREDPQYQEKVQKAMDECKASSTDVIEKSGGLLSYYSRDLVQKDQQLKRNQAIIWTRDSEITGNMRNITESVNQDVVGSFTQQEVQCSPITNLAVMNKIQLQQQAANAELNQMIVEQLFKQNALKQAEENKKKQEEEEAVRRAQIEKEMERRKDYINDDLAIPDANGIGF